MVYRIDDIKEKLGRPSINAVQIGLKVNFDKIKLMRIVKNLTSPLTINVTIIKFILSAILETLLAAMVAPSAILREE